jgi:hypothetical protein
MSTQLSDQSELIAPPASIEIEDPIAELAAIEEELNRRQFLLDPVAWDQKKLKDHLWSAQKKILAAVATHRKVLVRSCHDVGKSFITARLIGWWIDTSPPGEAFAITSAPSAHQVRTILWREINRVHTKGNLGGRMNQTEWLLPVEGGKEELVAYGRKPDDFNPDAFQGIHAPRVLVAFDEGNGIRGPLWEAAESLIANDQSKMVAIGNPDDPSGEFWEFAKPGSGWHVIEIGAFDSPAFTGEPLPDFIKQQLIGRIYVEDKRRKWAPTWVWIDKKGNPSDSASGSHCVPPILMDPVTGLASLQSDGSPLRGDPGDTNPLWQSKILGKFPELSDEGGLIPLSWIIAAQQRVLTPGYRNEIGLDVGGGGDSSCIAHRRGGVVRIIREDHNPDTMATCGNLLGDMRKTGATLGKVDVIGIGRGVVDRALEQDKPVVGINVGSAPSEEGEEFYANFRAEAWWNVRELFESGDIDIDPNDDDLAGELAAIRYKRTSNGGKIQIESKDEAKRRGIPSPNRADAVMLAFCKPGSDKPKKHGGVWGNKGL